MQGDLFGCVNSWFVIITPRTIFSVLIHIQVESSNIENSLDFFIIPIKYKCILEIVLKEI